MKATAYCPRCGNPPAGIRLISDIVLVSHRPQWFQAECLGCGMELEALAGPGVEVTVFRRKRDA